MRWPEPRLLLLVVAFFDAARLPLVVDASRPSRKHAVRAAAASAAAPPALKAADAYEPDLEVSGRQRQAEVFRLFKQKGQPHRRHGRAESLREAFDEPPSLHLAGQQRPADSAVGQSSASHTSAAGSGHHARGIATAHWRRSDLSQESLDGLRVREAQEKVVGTAGLADKKEESRKSRPAPSPRLTSASEVDGKVLAAAQKKHVAVVDAKRAELEESSAGSSTRSAAAAEAAAAAANNSSAADVAASPSQDAHVGGGGHSIREALAALWDAEAEQTAWVGVNLLTCLLIFELTHRRFSRIDFGSRFGALDRAEDVHNARDYARTLGGGLEFWKSYACEFPQQATSFTTFLVLLVCIVQYTNMLLVGWSGRFWDKVQAWGTGDHRQNAADFYAMLLQFLGIALLNVVGSTYREYVISMFTIQVRCHLLERYINLWLQDGAHYRLSLLDNGLDNPDQRIQEDSGTFVSLSISSATGLLNAVVQFFTFAATVCYLSPPEVFGVEGLVCPGWLFWGCALWAVLRLVSVHWVAARLFGITLARESSEADFRWELSTVRRYSEQIALGRSEAFHQRLASDRMYWVRRCVWEHMFISKRAGLVSGFLGQASTVLILIALGNSFLKGRLTLGSLLAADHATKLLISAMMWPAESYGSLRQLQAITERLLQLEAAVKEEAKQGEAEKAAGGPRLKDASAVGPVLSEGLPRDGLQASALTVWLPRTGDGKADATPPPLQSSADLDVLNMPQKARKASTNPFEDDITEQERTMPTSEEDDRVVLRDITLSMPPQTRALLVGASGSGKSSLIRALSGAWPFARGQVSLPGGRGGVLFLSTETYMPPGELRDAITYPAESGKYHDCAIKDALRLVQLRRLLGMGLDRKLDWNNTLSHGEKARVSLARLALRKPKVCVLDEPLSHLHEGARAPLLRAVFESLPRECAILLISHEVQPDIAALFNRKYELDAAGKRLLERPLTEGSGTPTSPDSHPSPFLQS
eukprot:TRINITY_DN4324_c0_g2_i1.p1 TRINITY_DN4324_c0_g2~~TRINITY_DN4324_c0_g2_i1.p1  ORF type:complete len:987 (-),score=229.42 TRINITY_DN4324_c0_g2_i1:43-3003(-)